MTLSYRTKDNLAVLGGVLFILLMIAGICLSVWLHFFAPCEYVGWLPAKDVPSRCFSVDVR